MQLYEQKGMLQKLHMKQKIVDIESRGGHRRI